MFPKSYRCKTKNFKLIKIRENFKSVHVFTNNFKKFLIDFIFIRIRYIISKKFVY